MTHALLTVLLRSGTTTHCNSQLTLNKEKITCIPTCIAVLIIACFRIRTELYLEEQEEMERQKEKVSTCKPCNKSRLKLVLYSSVI